MVMDTTARERRPYYEPSELDAECERIVMDFLRQKYGLLSFPLSTDDLSILVEKDTSDLDLYADLSSEGEDVEGITDFFAHKKPAVKISKTLSAGDTNSHRLRNTLAHEYGHVKFHYFLWDMSLKTEQSGNFIKTLSRQRRKIDDLRKKSNRGRIPVIPGPRCRSINIIDASEDDWMEWQAGYAGGAMLMPVTAVKKYLAGEGGGDDIIASTAKTFDVSISAAAARLKQLGFLPGITEKAVPVQDSVSFK